MKLVIKSLGALVLGLIVTQFAGAAGTGFGGGAELCENHEGFSRVLPTHTVKVTGQQVLDAYPQYTVEDLGDDDVIDFLKNGGGSLDLLIRFAAISVQIDGCIDGSKANVGVTARSSKLFEAADKKALKAKAVEGDLKVSATNEAIVIERPSLELKVIYNLRAVSKLDLINKGAVPVTVELEGMTFRTESSVPRVLVNIK